MPMPAPHVVDRSDEFADRLRLIEDSLLRLLQHSRVPLPRASDEESSAVDSETRSLLDGIRRAHERADQAPEPPTIVAPTPLPAGPSFDEQLMEIMMSGAPTTQGTVQPPPPLIPLVYRPGRRLA